MSDAMREAFEAAVYQQSFVGSIQVVQTGPGETRLLADSPTKAELCRRDEGGHYVDETVGSAWWAWQQATAAEQTKRADLLAALNGVLWMAEKWADDGNMREEREACEAARVVLGQATT